MITNVDEWQRLYEVIAADLQTSECKNVLVFVSGADVDAVAAARTLKVRMCCQPDLLLFAAACTSSDIEVALPLACGPCARVTPGLTLIYSKMVDMCAAKVLCYRRKSCWTRSYSKCGLVKS